MIAAIYVADPGPYISLDGVDAWPASRDARKYRGPYPAIAHPDCSRWGRYWGGGPSVKEPRLLGDDGGCFAHALWTVRTFGGVIEHPEASKAWGFYGLPRPNPKGGWTGPDRFGGYVCQVEQGHYGHPARKKTWLYAVRTARPELLWGKSQGRRLEDGFHSTEERRKARAAGVPPVKRISPKEMKLTPKPFRDLLLGMVRVSEKEIDQK